MGASEKHDAAWHGTETEPVLFGQPGHCYDADGAWWHEPGSVIVDPGFERWLREGGDLPPVNSRHCCGVVGVHDRDGRP